MKKENSKLKDKLLVGYIEKKMLQWLDKFLKVYDLYKDSTQHTEENLQFIEDHEALLAMIFKNTYKAVTSAKGMEEDEETEQGNEENLKEQTEEESNKPYLGKQIKEKIPHIVIPLPISTFGEMFAMPQNRYTEISLDSSYAKELNKVMSKLIEWKVFKKIPMRSAFGTLNIYIENNNLTKHIKRLQQALNEQSFNIKLYFDNKNFESDNVYSERYDIQAQNYLHVFALHFNTKDNKLIKFNDSRSSTYRQRKRKRLNTNEETPF